MDHRLWRPEDATTLMGRLTHHGQILETGNDCDRFKTSSDLNYKMTQPARIIPA